MDFSFVQIFGLAGLLFSAIGWQKKCRDNIFYFRIPSYLAWIIYYFLLGGWTGLTMNAFCLLRDSTFYFRTKYGWADNKIWLFSYLSVFLVLGILGWHAWFSIFAVLAVLLGTFAFWQKKPEAIRLISFFSSFLWVEYNFFAEAYIALVSAIISLFIILIGIWRFDREFYFKKFFGKKSLFRNQKIRKGYSR